LSAQQQVQDLKFKSKIEERQQLRGQNSILLPQLPQIQPGGLLANGHPPIVMMEEGEAAAKRIAELQDEHLQQEKKLKAAKNKNTLRGVKTRVKQRPSRMSVFRKSTLTRKSKMHPKPEAGVEVQNHEECWRSPPESP
jgi:hypothetical protein